MITLTEGHLADARRLLNTVVGTRLVEMYRYAGFQAFEFGSLDRWADLGEPYDWTTTLVVLTDWLIAGPNNFVLASSHFGRRRLRYDDFALDFYSNLVDEGKLVLECNISSNGTITVLFENNFSLFVIPRATAPKNEDQWRILPPEKNDGGTLVLEGGSLYYV